jgi:hypothetical protein
MYSGIITRWQVRPQKAVVSNHHVDEGGDCDEENEPPEIGILEIQGRKRRRGAPMNAVQPAMIGDSGGDQN